MVLEYQRDQARRELQDLEENIHARRGSPAGPDQHWTSNTSDQDLLNMTAAEVSMHTIVPLTKTGLSKSKINRPLMNKPSYVTTYLL